MAQAIFDKPLVVRQMAVAEKVRCYRHVDVPSTQGRSGTSKKLAGKHSHVCRPDRKVVNMVGLEILNKAFALPVVFELVFFYSVEVEVKA